MRRACSTHPAPSAGPETWTPKRNGCSARKSGQSADASQRRTGAANRQNPTTSVGPLCGSSTPQLAP